MSKKINLIITFLLSLFFSILMTLLLLIMLKLANYYDELFSKFEIAVFLKKDIDAPEIIGEKIKNMFQVKKVKFVDKKTVYNKIKSDEKLSKQIVLLDENTFPDTFVVYPVNIQAVVQLIENLKRTAGIEEIFWDNKSLIIMEGILKYRDLVKSLIFLSAILISFFLLIYFYLSFRYKKSSSIMSFLVAFLGSLCGIFCFFILCYNFKIDIICYDLVIYILYAGTAYGIAINSFMEW